MLLLDPLELGLQAPHLFELGMDSLALCLRRAVTLHPGVQARDAYPTRAATSLAG